MQAKIPTYIIEAATVAELQQRDREVETWENEGGTACDPPPTPIVIPWDWSETDQRKLVLYR